MNNNFRWRQAESRKWKGGLSECVSKFAADVEVTIQLPDGVGIPVKSETIIKM